MHHTLLLRFNLNLRADAQHQIVDLRGGTSNQTVMNVASRTRHAISVGNDSEVFDTTFHLARNSSKCQCSSWSLCNSFSILNVGLYRFESRDVLSIRCVSQVGI